MKRLLLMLMFVFSVFVVVAQEVVPPTDLSEVFANFNTWFATLAGLAALTMFLTAFINKIIPAGKGWIKQLVSWGTGIVLCVVSMLVNLGFLADAEILNVIAYGVAVGLISNGIFDIKIVKTILGVLGLLVVEDK
jgi:hypothetical protein